MSSAMERCSRCLGMGYKGRQRPSGWKIETCRRCQGTGWTPARPLQTYRVPVRAIVQTTVLVSATSQADARRRVSEYDAIELQTAPTVRAVYVTKGRRATKEGRPTHE